MTKRLFDSLLRDSFLFASNDDTWKAKRKACGHAFYKDRLIGMIDTFKNVLSSSFEQWIQDIKLQPDGFKTFDISKEFIEIMARNIFSITLGEDITADKFGLMCR